MNNLIKRTISGALFVALIIASILLHKFFFLLVFCFFCAVGIYEFHTMTNRKNSISVNIPNSIFGALIFFISTFLYTQGYVGAIIFGVYILFVISTLTLELFRKQINPINNWAFFVLGQVFVALPFGLLNFILLISNFNTLILLSLFVIIWVNDTFAYLSGITLGKHKMFERISPKKSWEGFVGGAVGALIAGFLFSIFIPEMTRIQWLIFSQIIIVFGTFGDLNESLLKRTLGVKDSGNIMPGHGGLLDRFDSMLLLIPAVLTYLMFIF